MNLELEKALNLNTGKRKIRIIKFMPQKDDVQVFEKVFNEVNDSNAFRRGVLITETHSSVSSNNKLHGFIEPTVGRVEFAALTV